MERRQRMSDSVYAAIDLKSYYASLETVERGLDPMTTHLVVADPSRTSKTICLAVSPALKAYGIPGRCRLFEVIERVKEINARRLSEAIRLHKAVKNAKGQWSFAGSSCDATELAANPSLALNYMVAPPQMAHYMECSAKIYSVYLKYIAPEDIHVYSIDEVLMDLTGYPDLYHMTPRQLVKTMIQDVYATTGITAAAGMGTNLYLAKIAMDIMAKHVNADSDGVRIASLDEITYRKLLWSHEPLTDFWRVGRGYARKLRDHGLFTMGDIARCSLGNASDYYNEDLLYRLFGVNAELLIDHAWGWEPCTIRDIKTFQPENNSVGSGQVLPEPYSYDKGRLIVREMTDLLSLDLVDKGLMTDQLTLTVGYDTENLTDPHRRALYHGPVTTDSYGRKIPKHAHGTGNLPEYTHSSRLLLQCMTDLYDRIANPHLTIRRVTVSANRVIPESQAAQSTARQLDLFTDNEAQSAQEKERDRERRMQQAILEIQRRYGKNAILKGMNLEAGARTQERNRQVGGHKA